MLEVLYRIYEVADEETAKKNLESDAFMGLYSSISKAENIELVMDCIICDNREQFKEIIREQYGEKITFRYSKKLNPGDLYCVIIGEHCYNLDKYFVKKSYDCDYCGKHVETYSNKSFEFGDYEIRNYLYNMHDYGSLKFCSDFCKSKKLDEIRKELKPDEDNLDFWVSRDTFLNDNITGYIYKITKKSTGEFYVGQTIYVPIFRWGQHLKTERFPLENILDYKFEVIEIVPKGENILEREKYHIQECYKQCPEKSLNIMQTAHVDCRTKLI